MDWICQLIDKLVFSTPYYQRGFFVFHVNGEEYRFKIQRHFRQTNAKITKIFVINVYNKHKTKMFRLEQFHKVSEKGLEVIGNIRYYSWTDDEFVLFKLSIENIKDLVIRQMG